MLYIELPLTLDEIREIHAAEERASDALMAVSRFVGRRPRVYKKVYATLKAKGIDFSEIALSELKKEVELCRKAQAASASR